MKIIKAKAPGKLILSGEHAVVHGYPALAMAVNRYAKTIVSSQSRPSILFDLLNLKYKRAHTLETLKQLKERVHTAHQEFKAGERNIREVLRRPFELLQYTATNFLEKLNLSVTQGIKIHTRSDIPVGCGMGSSAATIVSTNHALSHYHEQNVTLQKYLELGIEAENMQHGRSSGIDLHLALHGGCFFLEDSTFHSRSVPPFNFHIIQTGKPESTTGECVKHVEKHFRYSSLGKEFEAVAYAIDTAWKNHDLEGFKEAIQENEHLLEIIGVVSEKVKMFIQKAKTVGAAIKVCGAGTVSGDSVGTLLIISANPLKSLLNEYGDKMESIECVSEGVH